jgi:hypothetical protein
MNDEYFRLPTEEERQQAANAWNTWKPGKGNRRGFNPFRKVTRMRDSAGRPLKMDGTLDIEQWIKEANERS